MGKRRGPWQDGGRAWQRLNGWDQDGPSANPGHPDDGLAAVQALADIGLVRRLLDQAELGAVRTARRHGRSWAEIATKLGVTRQSAWERWRDLDDVTTAPEPTETASGPEAAVVAAATAGMIERGARKLRRQSTVVVPNVIGRSWADARRVLHESGLVGVGPGHEALSPVAPSSPGSVITDQSPESGATVPPGSLVTLWSGPSGGSAGDREPRQPKPSPKSAQEMRYEPTDEAIG